MSQALSSTGTGLPGMQWSLADVASVLGLPLPALAEPRAVAAVTIDSRAVRPGDLFVALSGSRVDGHDYVPMALAAGAVAAVTERAVAGVPAASLLQVPAAEAALQQLARAWRQRHPLPAIAVTGSNGKTTVKGMIAAILAADVQARGFAAEEAVLATAGNLNNHLGLPLTLLRLRPQHQRAVFEMGMNHAGELTLLSLLAQPQVALVINVQRAHVGHFASLAGVAAAKGEIFQGLVPDGIAVINADDGSAGLLRALAAGHVIHTFSCTGAADVGPLLQVVADGGGQQLQFLVDGVRHHTSLALPGQHNAANALAAIAATRALGVPVAIACQGLAAFTGVAGRLQVHAGRGGARVIDDTYNANPDSVLAALKVLGGYAGRRILVLGDLGELGADTDALHGELGEAARAAGIDLLFGLGTHVAAATQAFGNGARHTTVAEELQGWLEPLLAPETTLLIKGSRFMRMERIAAGLLP